MAMSADVFVDGQLDRSVTNHNGTGRTQLQLTAGSHDIRVAAPGYSEDKKTIRVREVTAPRSSLSTSVADPGSRSRSCEPTIPTKPTDG